MEEVTSKQPGEALQRGAIHEIETEKLDEEVEATDDGVVVEHVVGEGANVGVGESACVLDCAENGKS